MIINKQGKLFGKISIIDILAVVAIIVIGLGIYTRFIAPSGKTLLVTGGDMTKLEYDIVIKDVREATYEALSKGGLVSDFSTKEDMGRIKEVTKVPATLQALKTDGTYVISEAPEKYDVTVTISVDGKIAGDGIYTLKNKQLTAGSAHVFVSKYAKTTGTISDIRTAD